MRVCVEDEGVGPGDQDMDRLFDAFFSTKPDGMGLGLSISRSIVEAHDGQLRAEPNPGGGTIFRFTLPSGGAADG